MIFLAQRFSNLCGNKEDILYLVFTLELFFVHHHWLTRHVLRQQPRMNFEDVLICLSLSELYFLTLNAEVDSLQCAAVSTVSELSSIPPQNGLEAPLLKGFLVLTGVPDMLSVYPSIFNTSSIF